MEGGLHSPWLHPIDQAGAAHSKEEEEAALAALEARLRGADEAHGGETHKALARAKAKARSPVWSTHARALLEHLWAPGADPCHTR